MRLARIPNRQWCVWIPVVIIVAGLWLDKFRLFDTQNTTLGHSHQSEVNFLLEHSHDIEMIEIIRGGDRMPFERRDGVWVSMQPVDGHRHEDSDHATSAGHSHDEKASDLVDQSIKAFLRTRIKRKFNHKTEEKSEYGLSSPSLSVNVYSASSILPVRMIEFGDVAPDPFSRYVATEETGVVMTVADYQYTNLISLIESVDHHTH